jgi:hypothetical protein
MAKQKRRSYGEPWIAERSPLWALNYSSGPPSYKDGTPEEQRQVVLDWEAKRDRSEANADWILWGHNLSDPAICTSLTGVRTVSDDRGIIAISKRNTSRDGLPTHEEYAKRIAACVTAMAGIPDPLAWVAEVRELLDSMARGNTDRHDPQVGRLLVLSDPIEEIPI